MIQRLLICLFLTFSFTLQAQQDAWVYLLDKENVAASIANPTSILTQQAIDRKAMHGVEIDERDVPLNEAYKSTIASQPGIVVMAKSKWMNALHVRGTETDIRNLSSLSFVDKIDFADKTLSDISRIRQQNETFDIEEEEIAFVYGEAKNQVEMINADDLHLLDYTGNGVLIAVMDSAFPNVETLAAFARMRDNGNYMGGYDFVDRTSDVTAYSSGNHGTKVLSTMAGYIENQYVGTAPDATYYLFRTEDGNSENPVEESYWVEAAERADSLGVHIVNTSLGYTDFDNPNYDYEPADMDGSTTFITRGANIAAEKGMLLVTSAGNLGNTAWGIVSAPADSPGVLSVGAVTSEGNYSTFSSRGSSIQPSIKPDVVAQGSSASVISSSGAIVANSGTSFSSPILAGGLASLWSANMERTADEIKQVVRETASQSDSPDYFLGYGIPNLADALALVLSLEEKSSEDLKIYPNPVSTRLYIKSSNSVIEEISIYNVLGKQIRNIKDFDDSSVNVSQLSRGVYLIQLKSSKGSKTFKFIKS